jgi:hypothetical protein
MTLVLVGEQLALAKWTSKTPFGRFRLLKNGSGSGFSGGAASLMEVKSF